MQEFIDPSLELAHFAFDAVGSTNDEAFKLGEERGHSRLFVTARRQTGGRGRRGRSWVSEPGNLYTSLFLRAPAAAEVCAELSFVAAVALHEALSDCLGGKAAAFSLKWPNDVLCRGAKVAGLLLEARSRAHGIDIVAGIGVNCEHHPLDTPYPATDLSAQEMPLRPETLFQALQPRFMQNLDLWNRGAGFSSIRAKWLKHASGLGGDITVHLEGEEIKGRFHDIDAKGRLVLALSEGGTRIIAAGDVFFPAPAR